MELEIGNEQSGDFLTVEETPLADRDNKSIGIVCDPVTGVYQQHFQLPEGLFITYVEENSTAHRQGLQEGDVLISLDDTAMTKEHSLTDFLEHRSLGEQCKALVYRRDTDENFTVTLTIEEAQ